MAAVQSIDNLVASVSALDTVVDSAVALINGFGARLQAGIDAALAGGATAAQLAPLAGLKTDLDARGTALAMAVAANTPAPPPPTPPAGLSRGHKP